MRVLAVRLSDQTIDALRATADDESITISEVVRDAIEARVRRPRRDSPTIEELLADPVDVSDLLDVASG